MLSQDSSTQNPMVQERCSRNFTSSTLRSIPTSRHQLYRFTTYHPPTLRTTHYFTSSPLHIFTRFTSSPLHIFTPLHSVTASQHHRFKSFITLQQLPFHAAAISHHRRVIISLSHDSLLRTIITSRHHIFTPASLTSSPLHITNRYFTSTALTL